jgi:ADP-ribose pyrophosphatase
MDKWKLIGSEIVLETSWLTIHKNQYEISNGSRVYDYFVVSRKDFVLVVGTREESVILLKQYRPATNKFYYCLPAGYLEDGENPVHAAERELFEEAGMRGKGFYVVGCLDPLPGYIKSKAYIVTCELSSEMPSLSENEEGISEIVKLNWNVITQMILNGEIDEMQAVAALLLVRQSL